MRKTRQYIIAVLLLTVLLLGTIACSSREDSDNSTGSVGETGASSLTSGPTVIVPEKPIETMPEISSPVLSSVPAVIPFPTESQPAPTPVPAQEAVSPWDKAVEYVANMTEAEKIYQLFIVNPDAVTGFSGTKDTGNRTEEWLPVYPVGGFVYQPNNIESRDRLAAMISGQQQIMGKSGFAPLLTCVDEEGGTVTRLRDIVEGTLDSMYSYEQDGPEKARENAIQTSLRLKEVGLNTDFAPVADVWSNDANTVIGTRAYSDDFNTAAELIAAAVEGFRSENIVCTLKHFPGHGDTVQDSHNTIAVVTKSREELETQEFLPFISGIEADADMVMIGHLTVKALDESGTPATFSKTIITDFLRGELGFEGVIITDSLRMSAATEVASGGEACVRALEAGCDILLGAADSQEELEECYQAILDSVASGRLSWNRIDESVCRMITLKYEHGILSYE